MQSIKYLLFIFLVLILRNNTIAQKLKPGDTDPKAKVLEADVMNEFNNGAAVIQKGNAHALIDMNGNFLAPYNKYKFNFFELGAKGVYDGIFTLELGHEAVNAKGELIAKGLTILPRTPRDGRYRFAAGRGGLLAINSDDQRFLVKGANGTTGLGSFSEGLINYNTGGANNFKSGFKNLNDQIVIQPAYDLTGNFSDGMALVGCKNEFGEMKYGFINKEGQQVIPCIFTNRPSDFYCGRSLVYPKANSGFEYAYINKKGEIAIKYTTEMYQKYSNLGEGFYNGYTFGSVVMDTAGKVYTYPQFFAKYGVVNPTDKNLVLNFPTNRTEWTDGEVFMFSRFDNNNRAGSTTGFIDVTTNKVVEGPFFNTKFYFDPVSKLAYAEIHGNDATNITVKKGYINKQGIFVIVKAEQNSKW